ncbi:hypothetical protein [Rathayibacter iranicus]|uniref:Uncharacterized protein n=2 Tax=Rathayibacter iranicus TaxID=59737 RepID=A0AAD1ABU6_9MICO|nr:hypothetical protein [Rathayibacter iranicus]AZZ55431.1 hypothetical protein C7V51_05695 [Rathayibacter iranicus]MWV30827.1 hypothetical protein [Rathayibacter iranicus NCPPB 2253 = VKM Ac-1602]PPI48219.1 hypothetical protein C5E09_04765 [Rathayibacter iranicus]PPI61435.1 hypothetical protein C5E08_05675 [Rathayibacter iranicus]PPI72621.1 hypothetical protein C5E01_04950 [Rathayibacter iranicus]
MSRIDELEPGMHRFVSLGEQSEQLPGASLGWNLGGMGVHWTAATPWPEDQEQFGDPERWPAHLATARRLLKVSPSPIGPTIVGRLVLDTLGRHLADVSVPGREPMLMPMAVTPTEGRGVRSHLCSPPCHGR